jgi:hypothetical protein
MEPLVLAQTERIGKPRASDHKSRGSLCRRVTRASGPVPTMSTTIKELKPIPENPPRWKPSSDPTSITVAGLGTTASVTDQIDQIDQLITLKLQVSLQLSNVFCLDFEFVLATAGHRCQLFQDATNSLEPDLACFQTILDRY